MAGARGSSDPGGRRAIDQQYVVAAGFGFPDPHADERDPHQDRRCRRGGSGRRAQDRAARPIPRSIQRMRPANRSSPTRSRPGTELTFKADNLPPDLTHRLRPVWDTQGKSFMSWRTMAPPCTRSAGRQPNSATLPAECMGLALSSEGLVTLGNAQNEVWLIDAQRLTISPRSCAPAKAAMDRARNPGVSDWWSCTPGP